MASLWLARWPNGEVVLARADTEDEIRMMLDEADDPGGAKIEEYGGPMALVLEPKLPGRKVHSADYCRPKGPPTPPDALRRRLWEQQQQGQLCDVQLQAGDGATRQAHRAVICAACPELEGTLGGSSAPRTPVVLPAAPTGPILDTLLRWIYLQEANFEHAGPKEVLPAAQQLGLEDLAAECDYALARRLARHFRHEGRSEGAGLALDTLQFADRHARPRLARCALASLPGDCWRELQALPAFNELPQALAAAALAAASRDPVWVRRDAGLRIVSVEAVAYLEAGGQLTREEEVELREHQQMRALCAQHAQQVQQAQQTQQAYEVTQEDLEASDLNEEYPSMQWQLKQPSQSEYEQSSEMWTALARFACPHLAAEIERRRDSALDGGDQDDEQATESDARLRQAVAREAGCGEPDPEAVRRWAEVVVRAERGDRQAQIMVMMDVSVSGALPGL